MFFTSQPNVRRGHQGLRRDAYNDGGDHESRDDGAQRIILGALQPLDALDAVDALDPSHPMSFLVKDHIYFKWFVVCLC